MSTSLEHEMKQMKKQNAIETEKEKQKFTIRRW